MSNFDVELAKQFYAKLVDLSEQEIKAQGNTTHGVAFVLEVVSNFNASLIASFGATMSEDIQSKFIKDIVDSIEKRSIATIEAIQKFESKND